MRFMVLLPPPGGIPNLRMTVPVFLDRSHGCSASSSCCPGRGHTSGPRLARLVPCRGPWTTVRSLAGLASQAHSLGVLARPVDHRPLTSRPRATGPAHSDLLYSPHWCHRPCATGSAHTDFSYSPHWYLTGSVKVLPRVVQHATTCPCPSCHFAPQALEAGTFGF